MPLNVKNQCVTNPSNKTKPYKYTSCVSREKKRLLGPVGPERSARGKQKSKTGPVKSFAHQGAALKIRNNLVISSLCSKLFSFVPYIAFYNY